MSTVVLTTSFYHIYGCIRNGMERLERNSGSRTLFVLVFACEFGGGNAEEIFCDCNSAAAGGFGMLEACAAAGSHSTDHTGRREEIGPDFEQRAARVCGFRKTLQTT